jgi:hypothetical protein
MAIVLCVLNFRLCTKGGNPANGSWRMVQILSTKNAAFLPDARSAPKGFRNPISELSNRIRPAASGALRAISKDVSSS